MAHKFKPEITNSGCCFADCKCGWSGGVYPDRTDARVAWQAHVGGTAVPEPIRPTMLLGGPIVGQGDTDD